MTIDLGPLYIAGPLIGLPVVGSVGRPDLHAQAREYAGKLPDGIHAKLMTLPDDIEVYPGHLSGSLCGAGLSGKPSSTIAFETRCNAVLSKSREEFIEAMADVPERPADMEEIMRVNRDIPERAA